MTYFKFHNTIHIFKLIARTNQFRITIDSHQLGFALLRKNGIGCIFKFTYRYKNEKDFVERKCKEYPFESWSCLLTCTTSALAPKVVTTFL